MLLGLFSPSHHLSEHYLAKIIIWSTQGVSPAPSANIFQAVPTLPCPVLTYLNSSSISCLLTTFWWRGATHHICNSLLLHIKERGLARTRNQNNAWDISACFWIIQRLEARIRDSATGSQYLLLHFWSREFAGILVHGTLSQNLCQMINPANLHKYWCQSGWLLCDCGACVDLLDIQ